MQYIATQHLLILIRKPSWPMNFVKQLGPIRHLHHYLQEEIINLEEFEVYGWLRIDLGRVWPLESSIESYGFWLWYLK
jgi:hypothetical protein